jgi:molybdate transport system ATP-binding protein
MKSLRLRLTLTRPEFALAIDESLPLDGITGILGANGAGKTTLLRIIAGLEQCPDAEILCGDVAWQLGRHNLPSHRRRVGFVFQDGRLFPHLSVEGNLRFARRRPGSDRMTWSQVVDGFDLADLLERRPATLSAGERQRVAIARALLADPVLILMDEPLSSIDRFRKHDLLPYIERLPRAFGLPVLYVTHQLDELTRLASRLALMDRGRIVAHGPIAEILERTDLGALDAMADCSSLLEGSVVSSTAETTRVRVDEHELRLPALSIPDATRVRLRVQAREVAIALTLVQGLSIRNILPARILAIEVTAGRQQADVLLDLGRQHLRARVTVEATRELGLAPGQAVYALIKSVAFDTHFVA